MNFNSCVDVAHSERTSTTQLPRCRGLFVFFFKFIQSDAMLAASSVCIPITMYDRPLLYGFDVPVKATRTLSVSAKRYSAPFENM